MQRILFSILLPILLLQQLVKGQQEGHNYLNEDGFVLDSATRNVYFDNEKVNDGDIVQAQKAPLKGGPSKPKHKETYQDIFGNPHKPKRTAKNRFIKKPVTRDRDLTDYAAYRAGLPGFVMAEIDPRYYLSEMGLDMGEIQSVLESGLVETVSDQNSDAAEFMCKKIAFDFQHDTEIQAESAHWIQAKGACMFQILMDDNFEDVQDWLEEREYVIGVEGDSPINMAGKHISPDRLKQSDDPWIRDIEPYEIPPGYNEWLQQHYKETQG